MATLIIVAPVILMLALGMLCNKKNIITANGVENIKKYITTFALPMTIFHALSTAEYNKNTLIIFIVMLTSIVVAMVIGYILKGVISEQYKKYFPFLITVYEGGMLAYPLYQNLCGKENLSNIAVIDMASCVFSFAFFLGMLQVVDRGEKMEVKTLAINAIRNPSFICMLLGLIFGMTGLMNTLQSAEIGGLYNSMKDIVVAPLSTLILLVIGYDFVIEKGLMGVCLKTTIIRLVIQSGLFALVMLIVKPLGLSTNMLLAFGVYFFATPSLCLTSFVKNKEANKYISTTASLYTIITIIAYVVIANQFI